VALAVPTSPLCSIPDPPLRADTLDRVVDGDRCWIGFRNGATLVASADIDLTAPFGLLIPVDDPLSTRSNAAERLRRHLQGTPAASVLPPQSRDRFAAALRVVDAQVAGAPYRDIAIVLFGEDRVAAEHWPTSALKAQTARLAAHGRWLVAEGYRGLLRGRIGRRALSLAP
jgi:hypothetical protein